MEKQTLSAALNEFSQGTTDNIDSIMIKDAAGKPYWMKKADLKAVIFESINVAIGSSLDEYTSPGDYYFTLLTDSSRPAEISGTLVYLKVRKGSGTMIQEICSANSPNVVCVRGYSGGKWGEWMKR